MCRLCSAGRKKKGRSMTYLITFLEGLITFISPCLLPMLPVYVAYFAGGKGEQKGSPFWKALLLCWALQLLSECWELLREQWEDFSEISDRSKSGLWSDGGLLWSEFSGSDQTEYFRGTGGMGQSTEWYIFYPSFWHCIRTGWTPCIGAFLGSALMLASSQASWTQGILLLLCYSAGLGIPFLISAVLIQKLKPTFDWIKSHYGIINKISGGLLILVGSLMMTGLMNQYLA